MMPASHSYASIKANEVIHKNRNKRQYQGMVDAGEGCRVSLALEAEGIGSTAFSVDTALVRRAADRVMGVSPSQLPNILST
jgi:hypothetical protein